MVAQGSAKEAPLKTMTKRDAAQEASARLITWSLRGRTYVPVPTTASRALGGLDEDRANSMTDEGGPPQS